VKIICFDLDCFVCHSFLKGWHRLISVPEHLGRAVFETILVAEFDSEDAIGQNRKPDIGDTDDGARIGNGLERGDRWERHGFLGLNEMD
jgi:hypothetical protein